MTATPYPLPRETRETTILVGNGSRGPYGPTPFRVFDVADVEVLIRPQNAVSFERTPAIVQKTTNAEWDTVRVTFPAAIPATTKFVIAAHRTHERQAAVFKGGSLNVDEVEKELSKQASVISELRRDVDRSVSFQPDFDGVPFMPIPSPGKALAWDHQNGLINAPMSEAEIAADVQAAKEARDASVLAQIDVEAMQDQVEATRDETLIYASAAQSARDGALLSASSAGYFPSVGEGVAATPPGGTFWTLEHDQIVYYQVAENLYNPADRREGYYVTNNGPISPSAGWAVTDFIPVTPGHQYTIWANGAKRQGLAFFTAAANSTYIDGTINLDPSLPLTVTAPAGANFLAVNLQSPTQSEPSFVSVVLGSSPMTAPTGGVVRLTAIEGEAGFNQITERVISQNLYDRTKRQPFYILTSTGNLQPSEDWFCSDYIPVTPGEQYTISSNGSKRHGVSFFTEASRNASVPDSYVASQANPLTIVAPPGANFMVTNVESPAQPEPSQIMINRGAVALPFEPFGSRLVIREDALPGSLPSDAQLVLAGSGNAESYVESSRSGNLIRNTFIAFPNISLRSYPCLFNLRRTFLDGALVRDGTDDIAPDHLFHTTIDGNHGYALGTITATAHGKTAADQGSRWSNGGLQYVLVQVLNANQLVLARIDANSVPVSGAYTHVSGATNTTAFTASEVAGGQWYPPHTNYRIRVLVDGAEVSARSGKWSYQDNIQVIETYDVLSREEIIAWWLANGGASGGVRPAGNPSVARTVTYHFDRDGQLSVYQNWLFLRETPLADLMGLQVGQSGSPAEYYMPNTVPFTYEGSSVDFSRKVPASIVSAGPSIFFNAARLRAEGEYAHRMLSLWPDKAFAVGFLPMADAALDVRRDRVSRTGLELRAASGKQYFRILDQGARTAQPGEFYSAIGYRHIVPRASDRTALYVVRTQGSAFVYVDWHNRSGLDRVPIPSDLTGKEFEVVDSRNVTVKAGTLSGSLPVIVSAASDNAYLVLATRGN